MKFQTALLVFAALALAGVLFAGLWQYQAKIASGNASRNLDSNLIESPTVSKNLPDSAVNIGPRSLAAQRADNLEMATFGTGCFWCTEAIFEELEGVASVVSGYSGGQTKNPTYDDISTGASGHAEVVQIQFDPELISFKTLLRAFWMSHDPTTLNKQGNDEGPQYRSVIFYHDEEQKELAERIKKRLTKTNAFAKPIVTEISPFVRFYLAEEKHQDFFASNGQIPYCKYLVKPKVEKFRKVFEKTREHDSK